MSSQRDWPLTLSLNFRPVGPVLCVGLADGSRDERSIQQTHQEGVQAQESKKEIRSETDHTINDEEKPSKISFSQPTTKGQICILLPFLHLLSSFRYRCDRWNGFLRFLKCWITWGGCHLLERTHSSKGPSLPLNWPPTTQLTNAGSFTTTRCIS